MLWLRTVFRHPEVTLCGWQGVKNPVTVSVHRKLDNDDSKAGGWKGIFSSCTGITSDEICLIQGIK